MTPSSLDVYKRQVPILGNVAAGEPLFAEENIEDYFPIPAEMVPNSEVFMLHVRGESMINVGTVSYTHLNTEF